MNQEIDFYLPNYEEFRRGYEIYNQRERRGLIYFEALSVVSNNWGNPYAMARGVQIIIRGWNYLYSNFDFDVLVKCIDKNLIILNELKDRDIQKLSEDDNDTIKNLFNQFNDALKRLIDNQKSPVSVAKAFCLFAPKFFPLWDSSIALNYRCLYFSDYADEPYFRFCKKMKIMAEHVKHYVPNPDDRSLLKRIDEYNYSKYTMNWL